MAPLPRFRCWIFGVLLLGGCHLILPFDLPGGNGRDAALEVGRDAPYDTWPNVTDSVPVGDWFWSEHGPLAPHIWVNASWDSFGQYEVIKTGFVFGINAFDTIAAGLAAVQAGGTVFVADGTYHGAVTITKPNVTLAATGPGRPIIDDDKDDNRVADSAFPVVSIGATGVTVTGFEIREGIDGVYAEDGEDLRILNNLVHSMYDATTVQGVGILCWGACVNNEIVGNEVHTCDRQGIYVGFGDTTRLSTGNLIADNKAHDNGKKSDAFGIMLARTQSDTVRANTVYGHQQTGGAGIHLQATKGTTVTANSIYDNYQGIRVVLGDGATIQDNDVADNDRGIQYGTAAIAGSPSAAGNRFCRNTTYALSNPSSTEIPATGCWWGAPDGPSVQEGSATGGDKVMGLVDFANWLTVQPGTGLCAN